MPTSLPIDIAPLSRQKAIVTGIMIVSAQTFACKTSRDGGSYLAGHGSQSTPIQRRASYAERDHSRTIDPGALDFIAGEDVEGDESNEEPSKVNIADEERGGQRVLKILKARGRIQACG